jgi:hypothetical protein
MCVFVHCSLLLSSYEYNQNCNEWNTCCTGMYMDLKFSLSNHNESSVFWDKTLCSLLKVSWCFEGKCHLWNISCISEDCIADISEERTYCNYSCENLKSYKENCVITLWHMGRFCNIRGMSVNILMATNTGNINGYSFICKVFLVRFHAVDSNTGAITVTFQISLHYSTHKVFKSHVKSSLADFECFFNYELRVAISYWELNSQLLVPIRSNPTADSSHYVDAAWTNRKPLPFRTVA